MNLRTHKRRACAGMARRLNRHRWLDLSYPFLRHIASRNTPGELIRCDWAYPDRAGFMLWMRQCDEWATTLAV